MPLIVVLLLKLVWRRKHIDMLEYRECAKLTLFVECVAVKTVLFRFHNP